MDYNENDINNAYLNLVSTILEMPLKIVRESIHPRTVSKWSIWMLKDGRGWFKCLLACYGKTINDKEYTHWVKTRCQGDIPTLNCQKKL